MMLVEVAMDLMQPRLVQHIIDAGIEQGDQGVVVRTGLLMLSLAVIGCIGGVLCGIFAIRASMSYGADIRGTLFRKVQSLSFGNLDRLETGGLITRLTNDVTQLHEAMLMVLRIMVRAPLLLIGSLVLSIITAPTLALMYLALVPVLVVTVILIISRAFPRFKLSQERLDVINGVIQENLAGVRVVKAFARHDFEQRRFGRANENLRNATIRAIMNVILVMPIMMLTVNAGILGTLWFGGHQVNDGDLDIGQLIAFSNYLMQSLFALLMVAMLTVNFSRAGASAERVCEVLDAEPDIENPPTPIADFRASGEVRFDHVTFSYPGVDRPVLTDITFTAEAGKVLAILGSTGSGKSSLIGLIPRFYDVDAGQVLIDGVDVREIDEHQLRDKVAIALQESVLFSGSIRDNIAFGNPNATDEEIRAAAVAAQADPFIQELPDGYTSTVGQRGVNLSGGQKQRIAIARALVKRAPILILDDSTSAVDVATEGRIQDALAELDQTSIIVAQRISAVATADHILVLDDGHIVAQGTHDELMVVSEIYRDIYQSQMESGVAHGAA